MGSSTPTQRHPVPGTLHGFVDESVRPKAPYLVCATVVAPQDLSEMRAAMKALRVPGARRIHMESDGRHRQRFVAAVAEMDIDARLYLGCTSRRTSASASAGPAQAAFAAWSPT